MNEKRYQRAQRKLRAVAVAAGDDPVALMYLSMELLAYAHESAEDGGCDRDEWTDMLLRVAAGHADVAAEFMGASWMRVLLKLADKLEQQDFMDAVHDDIDGLPE